jgi:hypothetical protein
MYPSALFHDHLIAVNKPVLASEAASRRPTHIHITLYYTCRLGNERQQPAASPREVNQAAFSPLGQLLGRPSEHGACFLSRILTRAGNKWFCWIAGEGVSDQRSRWDVGYGSGGMEGCIDA